MCRSCYCRLRKTFNAKKSLLMSEHNSRQAGVRAGTLNPRNSDFERDDIASSCWLKQESVAIQRKDMFPGTRDIKLSYSPLSLVVCARRFSLHSMVPTLLERCLNNEAARCIPNEIERIAGYKCEQSFRLRIKNADVVRGNNLGPFDNVGISL